MSDIKWMFQPRFLGLPHTRVCAYAELKHVQTQICIAWYIIPVLYFKEKFAWE